jgi:hypothetical protein
VVSIVLLTYQRSQQEHEGVVPRPHYEHHSVGIVVDVDPIQKVDQSAFGTCGLDPARQLEQSVSQVVHQQNQLPHGHLLAMLPQVFVQSLPDLVLALHQKPLERLQLLRAKLQRSSFAALERISGTLEDLLDGTLPPAWARRPRRRSPGL